MNIELNTIEHEWLERVLKGILTDIKQGFEDNAFFYQDEIEMADEGIKVTEGILKKINSKKCEHEFEAVAFNTDLPGGIELYDCICKKCGEHSVKRGKDYEIL